MRRTGLAIVLAGVIASSASAQRITVPEVKRDAVICFALYTVHEGVLKLTAQMYPLLEGEPRSLSLEIRDGDDWRTIAEADVIEAGWTAPFRVEAWDDSRAAEYRVNHADTAFYTGTIRANPVDKDEFVVAFFTGNSINPNHGGDLPKSDIVENIRKLQPDLLAFLGDQVYNHTNHYAHWLKFGRDFGDIIRDFPTVTIPDDHDVGHANLWGAGGKVSEVPQGHDGGYFMPVEYVQEVERAQTSHLPDPYDPTPIERGIGVYYTDLTWGGMSFAILEDRKWKSGPEGLVPPMGPRPDHVTTPDYDPAALDVEGAVLLGERQLAFLRDWAGDWNGAEMKAVLSQTIFCGGAHLHGKYSGRLYADLDSNGWPQTGRNRALREIRKALAPMLGGDQHLATVMQHGIDEWGDAGFSFCTPSIANLYLRWWEPLEPGKNRAAGAPEYTGEHLDGFANKVTVYAAANPDPEPHEGPLLTTRAAGFGVARFDKPARTITFECWPRNVDIADPATEQYPGWPITIRQDDNYGGRDYWLPPVRLWEAENPVVQVIAEATGEVVYTLRTQGETFQLRVPEEGYYSLVISNGDDSTMLTRMPASREKDADVAEVRLR